MAGKLTFARIDAMSRYKRRMLWAACVLLMFMAELCSAHAQYSVVDRMTLEHKLIVGYQGWFECPASGGHWVHWMKAGAVTVDMLPDVSELNVSEKCATGWKDRSGKPIYLYSSQNPETVDRQFAWMSEYGIDGAALQRFVVSILNASQKAECDQVLRNVHSSAERHGRTFYIEYDLTGINEQRGVDAVLSDWREFEVMGLVRSRAYQWHRGHPVIGVFGLGFPDRSRYISAELAMRLIAGLRKTSEAFGGVTILAGVPSNWRTLDGDADRDPHWTAVYHSVDIISPWSVGRYRDGRSADRFRATKILPDLAETRRLGIDYMPVIFPGFSWHNLWITRGKPKRSTNQIPRECGRFYWHQAYNAVSGGSTMLFTAMFDELDEGTAIEKIVPSKAGLPVSPPFVSLDADGCKLPSDWYLRIAGSIASTLHGERSASSTFPFKIPAK